MLLSVEDKIITSTQRSLSSGPKVAVVRGLTVRDKTLSSSSSYNLKVSNERSANQNASHLC